MKRKNALLTLDQFGSDIGLSEIDKKMIRQKNKIITFLKNLRLKKNISQKQLAKKLGTAQPAIARMEAGHVGSVSFDFLVRVGIMLGVTITMVGERMKAA
ncbi:MAG: helix-turn-helix transcriptional regulator [Deltaproteobacteria bacterium]|nr:helix-turn-helix transcriptional regulator [Deltaproteobacteria bacterium]